MPEDDVHAGTGFAEAKSRLVDLLRQVGWPLDVAWVDESHVISFPHRVFVFLPAGHFDPEPMAQTRFEFAAAQCPALRLGAIGIDHGALASRRLSRERPRSPRSLYESTHS